MNSETPSEAELRVEIRRALAAVGDRAMPAPTFDQLTRHRSSQIGSTAPPIDPEALASGPVDSPPRRPARRPARRRLIMAGALAVAAALLAVVVFSTGDGGNRLRTTPAEERDLLRDLPTAPDEEVVDEQGRRFLPTTGPGLSSSGLLTGDVTTIAAYGQGFAGLVFESAVDGDLLAGTRTRTNTVFSHRSVDGLLWTTGTEPVSGLPDNAAPITVIHSDGTWFGLFQAHHPAAGPTVLFDRSLHLGRSTDLERWETVELAPEPWGDGTAFIAQPDAAGLAVGGDRVVVTGLISAELDIRSVFPEAGDGPFCDLVFEAEAALRNCDGEIVQRVGEQDPTWAQLIEQLPEISREAAVWSGPVTGPLSLTNRDPAAQVAIDPRWDGEQFTALVPGFGLGLGAPASLITSLDGTDWVTAEDPLAGPSIYVGGRYRPMAEVNGRLEDPDTRTQVATGPGGAAILIDDDTLYSTTDGAAWELRRLAEQVPSSLLSDDPEIIRNTTVEASNLIVGQTHIVMEVQLVLRDGDQVDVVERGWFRLPIGV